MNYVTVSPPVLLGARISLKVFAMTENPRKIGRARGDSVA
jgi:hypothetical protein